MSAFICGVMTMGCTDDLETSVEPTNRPNGHVTLDLSLSMISRAGTTVTGEASNKENDIHNVDIFFYSADATDTTPATFAIHTTQTSTISSVDVTVRQMKEKFGENTLSCKFVAVANCSQTKDLEFPTLSKLKQEELTTDFKANSAPTDFVMTNFEQTDNTLTWTEKGGNGTVKLKRVAAKIRVALAVEPTVKDDDGNTWSADLNDMRLFINNGVTKGQLDGSHIALAAGDYYSIQTSGSQTTSDYNLARVLKYHDNQTAKAPEDESYQYYNDLPYYSYPNSWENTVLETTQTILTIVVPWEKTEGDKTTYIPTYYTIPVNNGTTIESNKYYYIRMHIGMMGSFTPEKPMNVEMECEIADWGQADDTNVNIRPVRYLIFNQTEFEMNNTTEIEIPFMSTHDCDVVKMSGKFYVYNTSQGYETERTFDSTTQWNNTSGYIVGENKFCNYKIDNQTNTLIFWHNFFDIWYPRNINNNYVRRIDGPAKTQSTTSHYLYSRFEVKLTVRHSTGNATNDAAYEETVTLYVYPAAYIKTENMSQTGYPSNRGWVYVNGYGTNSDAISYLGGLTTGGTSDGNSGDMRHLLTVTVTQLNDEEAKKWSIDDPRTYYINNDMSTTSMESDSSDQFNVWSDNSGPYTGKTIWSYFSNFNLSVGSWNSTSDMNNRQLQYYYPCAEGSDKANIISPKFIVTSIHAKHSGTTTINRESARRRCASLQEYGYPAGRWRLPTQAEVAYVKELQKYDIVVDVFYNSAPNWNNGIGTVWCNQGITATGNELSTTDLSKSYTRCIYDLWYWERVDRMANGSELDAVRIPGNYTSSNWTTFTWGDRPKENPLTRSGGDSYTIQDYLEENRPGNYAITRDGDNVHRVKME